MQNSLFLIVFVGLLFRLSAKVLPGGWVGGGVGGRNQGKKRTMYNVTHLVSDDMIKLFETQFSNKVE